jgi:hypothetical protein
VDYIDFCFPEKLPIFIPLLGGLQALFPLAEKVSL